jgi:hypothetical protein
MQYSLLTEVWGHDFKGNKEISQKKLIAGDDKTKEIQDKIDKEVGEGNKKLTESNSKQQDIIGAETPLNVNLKKLIGGNNNIIKNDNYILLGLLLLFIVDTFYNL